MPTKDQKIQRPYSISHPKKDGTYPVGSSSHGHVVCFAPTLAKARHVVHALNCYFDMGFDFVDHRDHVEEAFVDAVGKFHCPCGATHSRGPINGQDSYRCLKCGTAYKVDDVVDQRCK